MQLSSVIITKNCGVKRPEPKESPKVSAAIINIGPSIVVFVLPSRGCPNLLVTTGSSLHEAASSSRKAATAEGQKGGPGALCFLPVRERAAKVSIKDCTLLNQGPAGEFLCWKSSKSGQRAPLNPNPRRV